MEESWACISNKTEDKRGITKVFSALCKVLSNTETEKRGKIKEQKMQQTDCFVTRNFSLLSSKYLHQKSYILYNP